MKDFFSKTWVKITAWILWVISTVVLVIGGVTEAQFSSALTIVLGIIAGVSALITLIIQLVNKKE